RGRSHFHTVEAGLRGWTGVRSGNSADRLAASGCQRRSPLSPCPDGTFRLAFVRLSRVIDLPASTTFLNEVPRSLRRTNSLLVPVSINSRRPAAFFFAAVLRFGAALRFAAVFLFAAM